MKKTCTKCHKEKPATFEFFGKHRRSKDGLRYQCRQCGNECRRKHTRAHRERQKEYGRKYRENHREFIREYQRTRGLQLGYVSKYGITIDQYNDMLLSQGNKCAICGRHQIEFKQRLCVDHDHETGEVRGLLCSRCNMALGNFDDDIDILQAAISYLQQRRHNVRTS